MLLLCLFVCLFVCLLEFIVPLENFSLIWRRHHCRWRAANFDFDSWPLSSEGSLTCHTHCDTGLPFIMIISEDPWHLLPSVWQWSCHYLILRPKVCRNVYSFCPHWAWIGQIKYILMLNNEKSTKIFNIMTPKGRGLVSRRGHISHIVKMHST